jgi:glycosyltransferase involved in cell wall biosynthesis
VNEALASGLPVIVSRGCGAAKTLVKEGENGWTFEPGAIEELAALMAQMSSLSDSVLQDMGQASRQIVAQWGLDRFVDGVLAALKIPRRPDAGFLSNLLTRLWKGHVRVH